jgi:hypothetical protein
MTISRTAASVVYVMSDIQLFSKLVIKLPLYSYQIEPLRAIIDSVYYGRGREYLLVFSRQSGKNEAAAQLLVYLLNMYQRIGGNIVYAATGDGLGRGIKRLDDRLNNEWNRGQWKRATKPTRRQVGNTAVVFMSSHPQAATRGETADHLLIIDEMQDQHRAHIEAVFTPMRAARNATAVYLGTVRTSHDALWLKKKELERMTAADGIQRVFFVGPARVTAENPHYQIFLEDQVRRHGRHHPIISSEYYLEPLDVAGGLFPERRIQLMTGSHPRKHEPDNNTAVLALLDVGGQDEAATDPLAQLDNPGRDYTVCTIVEVQPHENGRVYHAVDILLDHGSRHFDGSPNLAERILAYLQLWNITHLIADAGGVGEGLADFLALNLGETAVTQFKFSSASKARIGSTFISLIETGRFKYWGSAVEYDDAWWFYCQAQHCTYQLAEGAQFDRDLRWYVPPTARISTPDGPQKIHDDRLLSAALIAEADKLINKGNIILGTAQSIISQAPDPFADMEF